MPPVVYTSAGLAAVGISLMRKLAPNLHQQKSKLVLEKLLPPLDTPESKLAFQYFPESITDQLGTTYSSKNIPGGSLPIYQWSSGGERSLSFQVVFSTDVDPTLPSYSKADIEQMSLQGRNVDVRAGVLWLRSFMMPYYSPTTKSLLPPPKGRLYIPNSGIGLLGGAHPSEADFIWCKMNECSVEWTAFFPSGYPRIAKVSLAFHQLAQYQGTVIFPHMAHKSTQERISAGWDIDGGYRLK